jgi:hypothetical protein
MTALTGQSSRGKQLSVRDIYRPWEFVVTAYMIYKLTKPDDKLIALSGAAQEI